MTIKVLYITQTEPSDGSSGGALRSQHVRNALIQCGEVDTLVIRPSYLTRIDDAWGAGRTRVALYGPGQGKTGRWRERLKVQCTVRAAIRDGAYDLIVVRYLGLAAFVALRHWSRLVLDADDLLKSGSGSRWRRVMLSVRNASARIATLLPKHVWYLTPGDAAAGFRRKKWSILSNATTLPDDQRQRPEVVHDRIVFVGYLPYAPNREGLTWFVDRVLPRLRAAFPNAELHAIGRPHDHDGEGVTRSDGVVFRGYVDDLATEYDKAACVIAPVFSGGGTQIKVIGALAHGRPLVASRFASAGYTHSIERDRHLRVADDSEGDWFRQCTWVLEHPREAEQMGRRGEATIRHDYGADLLEQSVVETISRMTT